MSIIVWSLLIAVGLIYMAKIPVAIAMKKQFGFYDNRYPRMQQDKLEGFGKRAISAHLNCFEALLVFAVGAFAAAINQVADSTLLIYCSVFIAARIAYILCYWFDYNLLRSSFWTIGFLASIGLLVQAL